MLPFWLLNERKLCSIHGGISYYAFQWMDHYKIYHCNVYNKCSIIHCTNNIKRLDPPSYLTCYLAPPTTLLYPLPCSTSYLAQSATLLHPLPNTLLATLLYLLPCSTRYLAPPATLPHPLTNTLLATVPYLLPCSTSCLAPLATLFDPLPYLTHYLARPTD